jgi:hypothetical protein
VSGRDAVISKRDDRTRASIRQSRTTNSAREAQSYQDEELHLLASRRRLLARDDWLALDHTRPLRIGFPTAGDKDRVGRRRKIKKSSATRTRAAQRRLVTPLFEERLKPDAYLMSGALSPEHEDQVEIRVGTGAFDSQSRPSRRSNISRNASMGAHSTALSYLSEESMLLGADGDTFNADQVEVPTYMRDAHRDREWQPASLGPGQIDLNQSGEYFSREPENSLALKEQRGSQQYEVRNFDENLLSIASTQDLDQRVIANLLAGDYPAAASEHRDVGDAQLANGFEDINTDVPLDVHTTTMSEDEHALEAVTEGAWRQLVGIVTRSESFTSKKAVNSASEHVTTSDITQSVNPGKSRYRANSGDADFDETPYHNALDQAHLHGAPDMLAMGTRRSTQSPNDAENNTDDEALWRDLIIGSEDSESGDELHSAWQRSRQKMRQSPEQPQSLQVSGLGTSDQATRGEATVCSPSLFAAQIASIDPPVADYNDVVEEFGTSQPNSLRNIHATSAKRLDPRRSKMPKESDTSHTRRKSHEHAASRQYSSHCLTRNKGRG